MFFVFITIFLIKPEKQVGGMPEHIYIHFLICISLEETVGEWQAWV